MPLEVVKPKMRGFISLSAHPAGLKRIVMNQVNRTSLIEGGNVKNTLILGSSMGYGLASSIVSLFGFQANTLGVCFERPPQKNKTGSAGWYNSGELIEIAKANNLNYQVYNGDAFSQPTKDAVIDYIKTNYGQLDLLVYSLAAPRRIDEKNDKVWNSTLKPIGDTAFIKNINLQNHLFEEVEIPQATDDEVLSTVKVMGGEDWQDWIDLLEQNNLLSDNFKTVAFSYIGPEVTESIYRTGTIGKAKENLEATAAIIDSKLRSASPNLEARVSVNKAIVTQASSAIPGVPLYVSMLFKLMKINNTHEDALDQIIRLFEDKKFHTLEPVLDADNLIRLDDYELEDKIQSEIKNRWQDLTESNYLSLIDLEQYKQDFNQIFGFDVDGIDYTQEVETDPKYSIMDIGE
ncbi:MAG: enoyl-[acyl-carrier-protein] reductase FabV [Chloroflexi bacterium]|nr:enoyl-[acyl-carrier-protein] reductase FabV [Chloroflexota bacterium]